MEYTIKIPENPEKQELEKVIKALLDFLPLHSIYLSLNDNSFSPNFIITLRLSKELEIDAMDVKPFVSRLFTNYPKFSYTLFEHWWAVDLWDAGSLFLMNHATGDKLAYSLNPPEKAFRLKNNKETRRRIRIAKKEYALLDGHSYNCSIYSKWLRQAGNYLLAAFHLHQAIKFTFQKVELILMGEYLASQGLEEHQLYLAEFYPEFGVFFDNKNKEEHNILKQLDNSHRNVLHNKKNKQDFTEEMIAIATTKSVQISTRAHAIFEESVTECKRKIKNIEAKNHNES
jgi:hypothetical protein